MFKFNLKKNEKGFTILEMLVSLTIIGLIAATSVVSYRSTNRKTELTMAAQKLASDIRMAQNYTLGTKDFNSTSTYGWGIHLDKTNANNTRYQLFADLSSPSGNKTYNAGEAFSTTTLPSGITVSNIIIGATTPNTADVFFAPPDPITYINTSAYANATVTLSSNAGTANVQVNFLGMVEAN